MPADYTQLDPLTDYLSLRKKQKEEQAALEAEQAAIDTPEQQNRSTVGRGLADLVRSLGAASNEYGRAGTGDKLMASTEGAYDSGKQDALKTFMDKRKKLATDKQAGMEDISTQMSLAKFNKEMTPEAAKMAEWKESKTEGRYYKQGADGNLIYATDEEARRIAAEKDKANAKTPMRTFSSSDADLIIRHFNDKGTPAPSKAEIMRLPADDPVLGKIVGAAAVIPVDQRVVAPPTITPDTKGEFDVLGFRSKLPQGTKKELERVEKGLDKQYADLQESSTGLYNAKSLVDQALDKKGNAAAAQTALGIIARQVQEEKGPLSSDDINRVSGNQTLVARLKRLKNKFIGKGTNLNDADLLEYKSVIAEKEKYLDQKRAAFADKARTAYGSVLGSENAPVYDELINSKYKFSGYITPGQQASNEGALVNKQSQIRPVSDATKVKASKILETYGNKSPGELTPEQAEAVRRAKNIIGG